MGKHPHWNQTPQSGKVAKASGANPSKAARYIEPSSSGECPAWSIKKMDIDGADGAWGWKGIPAIDLWDMVSKLQHYESMTWGEIERNPKRDHASDIDKLDKRARKRLEQLGMKDEETLFRFRLEGSVRVWGRRVGRVFEVLWYDPNHEIYTG